MNEVKDDSLYVFPVDITYNNNYKQGRIQIYGRTPADDTGKTKSVRVDFNYNVHCYLKLPDEFRKEWTSTLEQYLQDVKCITDETVIGFKYCEKGNARIFDFDYKHKLIKITFTSEKAESVFVEKLNKHDVVKIPKSGRIKKPQQQQDSDGAVSMDRFADDGKILSDDSEASLIEFPVVFFETRISAITRAFVSLLNPGAPIRISKHWNALESNHDDTRLDAENPISHVDEFYTTTQKYIHKLDDKHPLMTTPNRVQSMIFDIETETLDPTLKNARVLCISVMRHEAVTHKMSIHMYTWKNPMDWRTDGKEIKEPISMGALKNIYVSADERSMLARFHKQELVENKPCVIVGHNSTWFDTNYLVIRGSDLGLDELTNWGKNFQASSVRTQGAKWSDQLWSTPGRLQIDTMIFYKVYGGKEDKYGLGPLSEVHLKTLKERKDIDEAGTYLPPAKQSAFQKELVKLLGDDDSKTTNLLSPIKGDVHYTQMVEYFMSQELWKRQKLLYYCGKDTILTSRHYVEKDMFVRINMMARIFGVNMDTVMNAGQQDKLWVKLLICINQNGLVLNVWSKPHLDPFLDALINWKYIGGYVFDPKAGAYDFPVFYLDFESLYPSIMMAFWLCLSTIRPKALFSKEQIERLESGTSGYKWKEFDVEGKAVIVVQNPEIGYCPQLQAAMKKQRKGVKKQMAEETDPEKIAIHSSMEKAIKVYMNGMYGIFALRNGKLFYKFLSAMITQLARDRIMESAKIALEYGAQFLLQQVYGDTDSIALYIKGDTVILAIHAEYLEDIKKGMDVKVAARKRSLGMVRRTFEIANKLSDHVTSTLRKLHKTQGVDEKSEDNLANALTFAVDKVFLPFYIGARKKMYTGAEWTLDKKTNQIEDHTMPECKVTGIESKKSDRCLHLRNLLNTGIKLMNSGYCTMNDLMSVVVKNLNEVCDNKVPVDKMAIIKGLKHNPDDYKVKTEHIGVAKRKIKRGDLADTTKGSKLSYVHVLPPVISAVGSTSKVSSSKKPKLSIFDVLEREEMIKKRDLCEDTPYAIETKMTVNSKYYLTKHYPTSVTAIVLLFCGQDPKVNNQMKNLFKSLVARSDAQLNNCRPLIGSGSTETSSSIVTSGQIGASGSLKRKSDDSVDDIKNIRPSKRARLLFDLDSEKFNI